MLQALLAFGVWRKLVADHPATPVALSIVGIFDSRCVFANQPNLNLIGAGWPELANQILVGPGAAISAADEGYFCLTRLAAAETSRP